MINSTRSRRRLLRIWTLVGSVALLAALATGCGGGSGTTAASGPHPTTTAGTGTAGGGPTAGSEAGSASPSAAGHPQNTGAASSDQGQDTGAASSDRHQADRPSASHSGSRHPASGKEGKRAKSGTGPAQGGLSQALSFVNCRNSSLKTACKQIKKAIQKGSTSLEEFGVPEAPAAGSSPPVGNGSVAVACPPGLPAAICERLERITGR